MTCVRRVALVVLLATSASACREDGTVTVHSLDFKGVHSVDATRLKSVLATRENTKVPIVGWEFPWSRKNPFDRSRFEADLKRIEAFYADRGYPEAKVTDFDVKLNDKQDAVDVTLTVDEGAPVLVEAVQFNGFDLVPAGELESVKKRAPLQVGKARDRQDVTTAHEMAVNLLRDYGYPYARVATDENDGPDGHRASVVFTAEPGTLAHFGDVEVAGNTSVGDDVIRRQLTFRPGDLYSRRVVQDSQRRLYAMELFQFVNVESLNPEQQPPQLPTRVTVAEGRHQRVNFGVGYGTEEKARVDGEYHHVNFFGGARSAGVHGRWSSLDRGVRVDFTQPYVFNPHLSLGLEGQRWYTVTPAYGSTVLGAKTTLTRRRTPNFSWSVSLLSERSESTISDEALNDPALYADLIALGLDPTTGKQSGTLSSVGFDLQRTTADNLLNARRGYQFAVHIEDAGRLLPGTYNFYSASVDGRHYLPVGENFVVASRVQLGAIYGAGDDPAQVPFSKKYFLGGASSIRGWGRFEVSPLGGSGSPIGGNSMLAFSSEGRMWFTRSFGAVMFLDGGNVWPGDGEFKLDDLRYAVGTGLRYNTPVGPVRFDYGYQLNPIPGLLVNGEPQTRRWRIHFSIGQAF
jgi:outer membrane protein assembly complex protein YaeT